MEDIEISDGDLVSLAVLENSHKTRLSELGIFPFHPTITKKSRNL